jgi:hypothetical protein
MNLITTGIRDQATVRALSSFQNQINAANLRGLFSARPNTAPFGAWYHCSDVSPAAHANELYWYGGDSVGWLLMYGDGGTGGKPAGPDGAVQFSDGGVFGGQAELLWDKANDSLGILGTLTVEKAATGADTTLVWLKNPSIAYTALAAEVIEADASNAVLALVQFGSHYTSAPEFTNYSAVYSGSLSSALMLGALGPAANVEFWLYDSGYAGDHWRHVVDVQRGGVIPAAQDTYTLGLSSNRWSDVQTKALHVNGYALTMTADTVLSGNPMVDPMTTLGDMIYGGASPSGIATRLVGDTSNIRKFLRTLSILGVAQAPAWDTILDADVPNLTGKTYNALTLTARATGFTIAGGATSKTLTVNLSAALNQDVQTTSSPTFARLTVGSSGYWDGATGNRADFYCSAGMLNLNGSNWIWLGHDGTNAFLRSYTSTFSLLASGGGNILTIGSAGMITPLVGEYQIQSGAWAAPSGGTNGRIVTVYNSTQAASRLYVYSNGGWHYSALT